jgi:hypothetical protein
MWMKFGQSARNVRTGQAFVTEVPDSIEDDLSG